MSRYSAAVAMVTLGLLLPASMARADTGDILEPQRPQPSARDGFQAGPCTVDGAVLKCSPQTPAQFFKAAGGHPPRGFVQFIVQHEDLEENEVEPLIEPIRGRMPRRLRVDLPPGLIVNPEATREKCTLADFSHEEFGLSRPRCSPGTKIGEAVVKIVAGDDTFLGFPKGFVFLPEQPTFTRVDLFNVNPSFGEPALFGFVIGERVRALLRPEIAFEGDYHTSFTISNLPDSQTIDFANDTLLAAIHSGRLITFGRAGDGTFATLPTTCFDPTEAPFSRLYSSWMRMDSHEQPNPAFPFGSTPFESALPPGARPESCEHVPFDPRLELVVGTPLVDSPAAPTVRTSLKVEIPTQGGEPIASSHLRKAEVTLPPGMGLNPAGAKKLIVCPDARFHKGNRELQNECPNGSILGSAEIRTPVLSQALQGSLYLGEPKSNDSASGDRFRLFVEASSIERGVIVRLIGGIKADPRTGQLTAVFDDQLVGQFAGQLPRGLPQVPLESLTLRFQDGSDLLTSPPTCGRVTATSRMEPWARPGTFAAPTASVTPASFPGGGPCPGSLPERPFSPAYTARPDNPNGGSFSPFRVRLARSPGHQELKQLIAALPKGVIAKLAGIPYCAEAALAAAATKSGAAELQAPSCPAASAVGTTSTESGAGPDPLRLGGKVYLAGPYNGAPLSLAAITPALSGPFDLGNVVVRVALHLDPASAQITAVSDAFPDVFGGVKLSLRAIDLNLDRPGFMLNPTNCSAQAITGQLKGGGGEPADPAQWSSQALNAPFQATGCEALGFAPTLVTKLSGRTKRGKYPGLSATLTTRPGDANVASATLALPRAFLVAQEHISTVCTRPQLAAKSCPASSAYGQAEASSPLLDGKLSGPVYLVPGGRSLPDLVADLRGQVDVQLRGVIVPRRGRIAVVFDSVPDLPVREFTLAIAGGKKGLIVNSTNICKAKRTAELSITGQNGKQLTDKKYKLKLTGCKKRKRRGK